VDVDCRAPRFLESPLGLQCRDATGAQIRLACRQLRLPSIADRPAAVSAEAIRQGESHLLFLAPLLVAELENRIDRRRHRRIAEAHFPRLKRLEDSLRRGPADPAVAFGELADQAPASIVATLLDEGDYLCSIRTMYRILLRTGLVERRRQRHPRAGRQQCRADRGGGPLSEEVDPDPPPGQVTVGDEADDLAVGKHLQQPL
jgi:hypothetical protein